MVIDGSIVAGITFARIKFEGERLRLPQHLVERAKNNRFPGRALIGGWLLVAKPGRFRLITEKTEQVSKILEQIEDVEEAGELLDGIDDDPRASLPVRLIPCTISPPRPGWRVNFPKEAKDLVPEGEERRFVYGLISRGYIEIWFPDFLRREISGSIRDVLD